MEQASVLRHQIPIHGDYLPSDQDCIDQFSGHAHHSAYNSEGAVDQLRRNGSLSQPAPSPFAFTPANNARFAPEVAAADSTSYRTGHLHTDSSSGSISTSPSSAASTLPYTSYPTSHYTALPTFQNPVLQPQAFVPDLHTGSRVAPLYDGTTSGIPPSFTPIRSPISSSATAGNRDFYARSAPFLARTSLPPNGYASHTEIPRSVYPASNLLLSPPSGAYPPHMAAPNTQGYGVGQQNDCSNFPWPDLECLLDLTCDDQIVTPKICCKVEKGFFKSTVDEKWTCYRRNYFSVIVYFELTPFIHQGRMRVLRNGGSELIQAMGIRLCAAVDGPGGKEIELVGHTPKRDAGPKIRIGTAKVTPSPPAGGNDHAINPHAIYGMPMPHYHATGAVGGPSLPFQNVTDSSPPSPEANQSASQLQPAAGYSYQSAAAHLPGTAQSATHTFERVQFKQATANNGKRRASQQYFHLIAELQVDVRKEVTANPVWIKVARKVSDRIVVRGRSPSHYQNEGQNNNGRSGSTGGNPSYGANLGASYSAANPGAFRGSTSGFGGDISAHAGYRAGQYSHQYSPGDSPGSEESAEGGAFDSGHAMDTIMSDADRDDRVAFQEAPGYQYYPSTIYENAPTQLPLPKLEGSIRYSTTDPRQYAVKAEYPDAIPGNHWQSSPCGRLQGVDTSRGYYPTLSSAEHHGYT